MYGGHLCYYLSTSGSMGCMNKMVAVISLSRSVQLGRGRVRIGMSYNLRSEVPLG